MIQFTVNNVMTDEYEDILEVVKELTCEVIGFIPNNMLIQSAVHNGVTVFDVSFDD